MKKRIQVYILIIASTALATFVKKETLIKDVTTGTPYALLNDSTYVSLSYIYRSTLPYIELYAGISENEIDKKNLICKKDRWNNCDFQVVDTINLIGENNKVIGKVWNPFSSDSQSLGIIDLRKNGKGIQIHLDGYIDSINVYEFEPWKRQIEKIKEKALFTKTYREIDSLMKIVNNRLTDVTDNTFKVAGIYDEEIPNPNTSMLFAFYKDTVRAIWTDLEMELLNKEQFNNKFIYYSIDFKDNLTEFKKWVCAEFEPGIGIPNPTQKPNEDCRK